MLILLTLFLHESSCYTSVLFLFASHAPSHFILCFSDNLIPWRRGGQSAIIGVKTTWDLLMMCTENKPGCIECDLVHMYPHTNTSAGRGHVKRNGQGSAEPGLLVAVWDQSSKLREVIVCFSMALVWLRLECRVQFWAPQNKTWTCWRVQHRFTKLVSGLDHIMHKERLKEMHLHSLKEKGYRSVWLMSTVT